MMVRFINLASQSVYAGPVSAEFIAARKRAIAIFTRVYRHVVAGKPNISRCLIQDGGSFLNTLVGVRSCGAAPASNASTMSGANKLQRSSQLT